MAGRKGEAFRPLVAMARCLVNQPLPEGRAWYWTWLAPDGYAWFVPVLSLLLIATMALGPTFQFAPINIALLILGLAKMTNPC